MSDVEASANSGSVENKEETSEPRSPREVHGLSVRINLLPCFEDLLKSTVVLSSPVYSFRLAFICAGQYNHCGCDSGMRNHAISRSRVNFLKVVVDTLGSSQKLPWLSVG